MQNFNMFTQQINNRMSLQTKSKNVRVFSARVVAPQTEKSRPLSGVPNQSYTRKQMIINSYNSLGSDVYRAQSARYPQTNIITQNTQNDRYVKKVVGKQSKQKEQMASQIINLKQTVNRLVQQLSLHKGKIENMRKKNLKYSKILTLQFEDEKQWGSSTVNNHLVSGIKNMYDTLKQKYQLKCKELDNYIKKQMISKNIENEEYISVLEGQIKNLKKRVEKTLEPNILSIFSNQTQKNANQYVISDLQEQKCNLESKFKILQKKYKEILQNNKQIQLKVTIDKKLINQKDNNIHAFQRKNKELLKELSQVKKLNQDLTQEISQLKQSYELQKEAHRQSINMYEQKMKRQIDDINKEKGKKIYSLQQDNSYLHKMMQDLRSTNLELNVMNQELKQQKLKNSFKNHHNEQMQNLEIRNEKTASFRKQSSATDNYNNLFKNGKRNPQKADKKYHQNAIKTRKIELSDILQISQFIRLKLIAKQFSIDQVKKLFDYNPQNNSKDPWQKQYIKMSQVKQIFLSSPFNLDEQYAIAISRYLIQDVQQDYVFCDDLNENHREVVKSIIKTLIQQYPVYKDGSKEYYQMNQEIEKYRNNLKSALKSIAKDGFITKVKLLDVMKSIGMEIQTNILQLILSKMALKSKNINSLNYTSIF